MRSLMSKFRRVAATVGVEILLLAGIGVMDVSAQNDNCNNCGDDTCASCSADGGDWQAGYWINDVNDNSQDDPFAGSGGLS